jgi:ATP-dependent exoDNAse (exonuclease V) alpha subunit
VAEALCRRVLEKYLPWGGVRIIAVGDFAQLPPVSRTGEQKDWAFLDEAWEYSEMRSVVLKTIVRSQDEEFLGVLNRIREGKADQTVKNYLSARTLIDEEDRDVTYLFSRRVQVDRYNQQRISEIPKPQKEIPTHYAGSPVGIGHLKKNAPIPELLLLKEGALVMTRINDPRFRFINGSVGHVVQIDPEAVVVNFPKKGDVEIEKTVFSLLDGDGNLLASAENFPLNLAYALTIHKAQGTTLDEMVTDLRGLWEPGHAYVALSRLRSGDGLTLSGWDEASIRVDPQVVRFHRSLEEGGQKEVRDSAEA